MPRFRVRSKSVEAFRIGVDDPPQWFTKAVDLDDVHFEFLANVVRFDFNNRTYRIPIGYFFAVTDDGFVLSRSPEAFASEFESEVGT